MKPLVSGRKMYTYTRRFSRRWESTVYLDAKVELGYVRERPKAIWDLLKKGFQRYLSLSNVGLDATRRVGDRIGLVVDSWGLVSYTEGARGGGGGGC